MLISVAMTTYNGAPYLAAQLASLAQQTRLPDELIVCDDGSTDDTVEILRAFRDHAPFPVHVMVNEANLGVSANFERAAGLCRGDLLFLCDQDDVWLPNKVEAVARVFASDSSVQLVINDAEIADETLCPTGVSVLEQTLRRTGASAEYIHGCCTTLRRSLVEICLPLPRDEGRPVGYDGWLHTAAKHLQVRTILPLQLQLYRRHSANVSSATLYASRGSRFAGRARYRLRRLHLFLSDSAAHARFLTNSLDHVRLLRVRSDPAHAFPTPAQRDSLKKLEERLDARLQLGRLPATRRFVVATCFYCTGGYAPFSGWRSFVVDILKQRTAGT